MGLISTAVRHLIAAGISGDDLVRAIAEMEDSQAGGAEPVTKRQARNQRYYQNRLNSSENRLNKTIKTVSDGGALSSSPVPLSSPLPNPPPYNPPNPISNPEKIRAQQVEIEFAQHFWPLYPNKVGKPEGLKAFVRARQRADLETIMVGLKLYAAKVDDRAWCNPATWLNQDRWNDVPAVVLRGQPPPREPDLADFFNQRAKQLEEQDNDRWTPEGSYEHRDFDGPRQAVPRLPSAARDR